MGIPVIAGVDAERCSQRIMQSIPLDTRDRMLQQWGTMPFYESTEEGLYSAITHMLSKKVRDYWGKRGMKHFMQHHDAEAATSKLRTVYTHALAQV